MFTGSIPTPMRSILLETVDQWADARDVLIGCSGNFTVERVIQRDGLRLHGNDVSIYTCCLGAYLSGQPFRLEIKEAALPWFDWLQPYLKTPEGTVATIMLATKMLGFLNADGSPRETPYHARMLKAYTQHYPTLFAETVETVKAVTLHLSSFYAGDVVGWAEASDRDAAFVCYPPFYKGGYENLYKRMDAVFSWDTPTYPLMGEPEIEKLLAAIADRRHWMFATIHPHATYAPYLRGVVKPTPRNVAFYVYSATDVRRVVVPWQPTKPITVPHLAPGDTIGDTLTLAPLEMQQFAAIRAQFLNVNIAPANPSVAYGVLVDGKLIGTFALINSPSMRDFGASGAYMLSDFAVAPTDYPRLSKLVLYAALSKEAKLLAERLMKRRVRYLYTTAFSNNPNSMKYRGVFEFYSRNEDKDWKPDGTGTSHTRYKINYKGVLGQWSLNEGLALWKKKHGKKSAPESSD